MAEDMASTQPPMSAGPAPDRLPTAAWALAWSYLLGQLIQLAVVGAQDESAWPLSMLLGALIVAFFSHGVLRARMVRFVVVLVLSALGAVVTLIAAIDSGDGEHLVALLLIGTQLGCLVWFSRTPWFAWQRTRPEGGPSIAQLMMMAVVVGLLGGIIGTGASPAQVNVNLAELTAENR